MKHLLVFLLLFHWACDSTSKHPADSQAGQLSPGEAPEFMDELDFETLLDSAAVRGAILVFDLKNNVYYCNDSLWASTPKLPASTFKIPNTLIALETGVVSSDTVIFPWDGAPRFLKQWEQDLSFYNAYQLSCVPIYQEVARGIGLTRMRTYVEQLNYGNMHITAENLDHFWLRGTSGISCVEQIRFLRQLQARTYRFSERSYDILERMMVVDTVDHALLRGKTGWSQSDTGHHNGWFVGYLETGQNVLFVVVNIEPMDDTDLRGFGAVRMQLAKDALERIHNRSVKNI